MQDDIDKELVLKIRMILNDVISNEYSIEKKIRLYNILDSFTKNNISEDFVRYLFIGKYVSDLVKLRGEVGVPPIS